MLQLLRRMLKLDTVDYLPALAVKLFLMFVKLPIVYEYIFFFQYCMTRNRYYIMP